MKRLIPSLITGLRFVSAPLFYYAFLNRTCVLAFILFLWASLTDIADGYFARKLNATSSLGAYLDVFADFSLIIAAFYAFIKNQWYCYILLLIIGISFLGFILSSQRKQLIYDPVGKYFGSLLMGSILVTLLIPDPLTRKIITYLILIVFIISTTYRVNFFRKNMRRTPLVS